MFHIFEFEVMTIRNMCKRADIIEISGVPFALRSYEVFPNFRLDQL